MGKFVNNNQWLDMNDYFDGDEALEHIFQTVKKNK